jgi:hypothetical protein
MMLAQGGMEDELGQVDRSQKMADQLRKDAKGQMQGKQVGRVYIPPTIANLAADLYSGYQAGQMDQQSDYRREGINNRMRAGNAKYLDALTGAKRTSPHLGDEGE